MLEHRQIVVFGGKCRQFRILSIVQRLTALRIIDQFGRKRWQKKGRYVGNKLLVLKFMTVLVSLGLNACQCLKNLFYLTLVRPLIAKSSARVQHFDG